MTVITKLDEIIFFYCKHNINVIANLFFHLIYVTGIRDFFI